MLIHPYPTPMSHTNLHRHTHTLVIGLATLLAAISGPAQASQTIEEVQCTTAPASTWMTEAQARARFNAAKYLLVKFKISKGNCHEFYAVEHDGTVVEAYVHPVTGEVMQFTRIPPPGADKPVKPGS